MNSLLDQCTANDLRRLTAIAEDLSGRHVSRARISGALAEHDTERFGHDGARQALNDANALTTIAFVLCELADQKERQSS